MKRLGSLRLWVTLGWYYTFDKHNAATSISYCQKRVPCSQDLILGLASPSSLPSLAPATRPAINPIGLELNEVGPLPRGDPAHAVATMLRERVPFSTC